jgi:L-ribulokinase
VLGLDGEEHAAHVAPYAHGQITGSLPGSSIVLKDKHVCQDAKDWVDAAKIAVAGALSASGIPKDAIIGIGTDFTSCTLVPCFVDGSPLYFHDEWRDRPHAWPVLWKHHGAIDQADQLTEAATAANCGWLDRYSGIVGCEWLFPKALEVRRRTLYAHHLLLI